MGKEGFRSGFVAIIGRPNAGKSTLLNRLLGEKIAIMSDKAQTTRRQIRGVYTDERMQAVFVDTPGIHKPRHKLGDLMMEAATSAITDADLVLYLTDVTEQFGRGEEYILAMLRQIEAPVILLLNKMDRVEPPTLLPLITLYSRKYDFAEILPFSAKKGEGADTLLELIWKYLPEGPMYYPEDTLTDQTEREVIAELVREAALSLAREELPHALAVETLELREREAGNVFVSAAIYVERESQKGILIGKGGQMLKNIGSRARPEIEKLLRKPVYLQLWVKVRADWRDNQAKLRELGFSNPMD